MNWSAVSGVGGQMSVDMGLDWTDITHMVWHWKVIDWFSVDMEREWYSEWSLESLLLGILLRMVFRARLYGMCSLRNG